MATSAGTYFKAGFQVLHKNLYLFWINLAYMIPFSHIIPTSQQIPAWVVLLTPFAMVTLKLADTQLLYTQPQKSNTIAATYVITLYRYFFRIVGIIFLTGLVASTIFVVNHGDLASSFARFEAITSVDATLWQRLTLYLPALILTPLIPFFKIFWVVKRQSFFRSIFSGIKYVYLHPRFTLLLPLISLTCIVIEYPVNHYFRQLNLPLFTVLNVYVGLIMTSASIAYFKSHKNS